MKRLFVFWFYQEYIHRKKTLLHSWHHGVVNCSGTYGAFFFHQHTFFGKSICRRRGLWSKAQKDAVYQLLIYARTHNAEDYKKFREFMKVPNGDHKTLVELNKINTDLYAAKEGFVEGECILKMLME